MRPRFESLQAVRGAACLLVWGLHLALWEQCFGIARPVLAPLLRFGFGGVDLFFVLSGVLIAHTQGHHAGRPAAVPGYLLRRGWRVFPAYWVVFALALAGTGWGFGQRHAAPDGSPAPWAHWALLLPHAAPNTVLFCSWTLCYEVLFYAAFAAVLLLPRGWGAALLALWGVAVAWAAGWGHDLRAGSALLHHLLSPFVWEFLLGCGVAWLLKRGVNHWGWWAAGVGMAWGTAGVLAVSSAASPYGWAANELLRVGVFGPAAGLVVYGLAAAEVRGARFSRWLRATGDASYSVYLWHLPAGAVVFNLTTTWPHPMGLHLFWLLLMTAAGVGGGVVLHWCVERPLLRVGKRKAQATVEPAGVTLERIGVRTGAGEAVPAL